MSADVFSCHIEAAAKHFWGDPNPRLSSKTELRWGEHGSRAVDLEKGVWHDHEAGEGGGVIDLVKREARREGRAAVEYLREQVGCRIEDDRSPQAPRQQRKVVATYTYADENGEVLFEVVRFEPKDFRQRRPDGKGGWSWSVKGVRQVPYRLPEVIEAIAMGHTVYVVEGEKDADRLWKMGLPATCNAGGAGKWPDDLAPAFDGAHVVIIPDNDEAGRNHVNIVGSSLRGVAETVQVLELANLPPKQDVSWWLDQGHTTDDLISLTAHAARPWTPAPPASRFDAVQWCDLDHVAIRQDWLIEDIMFCGDGGLVFGASGSGKSFLALDAALAIAQGKPFLGKNTRQGAVIYQAGEGGKGLVKRMRAYRQYYDIYDKALPFVLLPRRADLFDADGDLEAFEQECLAWQASLPDPLALIVIDTLSTASPGANENASEDMGRMLAAGARLQKATGAAVLWVHHKNAAGDRERGHTSLRANLDTALEVTRDEETNARAVKLLKLKDGEDGLVLQFELKSLEIGAYDSGKPMTSCVVVPAEAGSQEPGSRTGRKPVTPAQRKFLRVLEDAITHKGGQLPPMPGAWNERGVEWADFRTLYTTVGAWPGQTDEAIRKALQRDGEALTEAGLISRSNPWIWLTSAGKAYLKAMGSV